MGVDGVGKTCLMRRYFTSTFSETPDALDAEFRKQPGMQKERYPTSQMQVQIAAHINHTIATAIAAFQ
jgi:GTPase SAR1 family protein